MLILQKFFSLLLLFSIGGCFPFSDKQGLLPAPDAFNSSQQMLSDPFQFVVRDWPGRVVSIGDLHGDADAARRTLQIAGAIDSHDRWIGNDLIVVQVGDQIDRGYQDKEILDLFDHLATEAVHHNSRLISLLGNHEIMNIQSDLRYVSLPSFLAFEHFNLPTPERMPHHLQLPSHSPLRKTDEIVRKRTHAFLPGAEYARLLAKRSFYAIVNDSFFIHGGVTASFRKKLRKSKSGDFMDQLTAFDHELREWMLGNTGEVPSEIQPTDLDESPLWSRYYSGEVDGEGNALPRDRVCAMAALFLNDLHLRRMVIGHTIQIAGINSICSESIWRVDIALSSAFRKHPRPQVLEISNGHTRVLSH